MATNDLDYAPIGLLRHGDFKKKEQKRMDQKPLIMSLPKCFEDSNLKQMIKVRSTELQKTPTFEVFANDNFTL